MPAMRRVLFAGMVALLFAGIGMALSALPASAHANLERTTPASGAILDIAPSEVTLVFSEAVDVTLGRVVVVAPDGQQVQLGKPELRTNGTVVAARLGADVGEGTFVVSYRVVSADGHPISGGFSFSIGTPSQTAPDAANVGEAPVDPVVRVLLSVAKYLGYAGLALLAGPVLIVVALWPRRLELSGPRRLIWIGWGLLLAGTVLSLYVQAPYSIGGGLIDVRFSDLVESAGTTIGLAQIVRIVLLLAAIPLLRDVAAGKELERLGLVGLGGLGVATVLTWPIAGHAVASPARLLAIPSDAVHVGAMGIWIGGLAVLAGYLLPWANQRELSAVLPVWSRWATYAVVSLVVSGVVQGVLEVETPTALINTNYGKLVLAKIAGLVVILGVAAAARMLVRRRIAVEDIRHVRNLRAGMLVEVGLAAVVLVLATLLVQTTPARTAIATTASQEAVPFTTSVSTPDFVLQIDVTPAAKGNNSVHLTAFTATGAPQKVVEWKATASNPNSGLTNVDIPLLTIADNHVVGEIQLPMSGNWQFKFTVRTSETDQSTVDQMIQIR